MKCNVTDCPNEAITFHGICAISHGYCEEHRCCYKCGCQINHGCKCKRPEERPEYLLYLKENNRRLNTKISKRTLRKYCKVKKFKRPILLKKHICQECKYLEKSLPCEDCIKNYGLLDPRTGLKAKGLILFKRDIILLMEYLNEKKETL